MGSRNSPARARSISPPATIPKKNGGLIRLCRKPSLRYLSCMAESRVNHADGVSALRVIQGASDKSSLPSRTLPAGTGIANRIDGFETMTPATPSGGSRASRSAT